MESSLVTMYGFRLNPRESSYVLDRLLETGRVAAGVEITPSMFIQAMTELLEQHPLFCGMTVRLVSTASFPAELKQIPNSFSYMFLFGFPVPNGVSHEEIRAVYNDHPVLQYIRLLRRFFREHLTLHLQFISDEAGYWAGNSLPEIPFARPIQNYVNLA